MKGKQCGRPFSWCLWVVGTPLAVELEEELHKLVEGFEGIIFMKGFCRLSVTLNRGSRRNQVIRDYTEWRCRVAAEAAKGSKINGGSTWKARRE